MLPNIFTLIGSAWDFYRKQPVLNSILLWMMILPTAGMSVLGTIIEPIENIDFQPETGNFLEISVGGDDWYLIPATPQTLAFQTLVMIGLSLVLVWGSACVLVVGKKLVSSNAGRARTSFGAVRSQAAKLIVNLLFTGILRGCFTLLWSLLLVVPGIIYSIRTSFYQIAIAGEGKAYREALSRSKEVVRGYTWETFLYFIGLGIFLYVPASLLGGMITAIAHSIDPYFLIFANIITAGLSSIATVMFLLCIILLYSEMQKLPHPTAK